MIPKLEKQILGSITKFQEECTDLISKRDKTRGYRSRSFRSDETKGEYVIYSEGNKYQNLVNNIKSQLGNVDVKDCEEIIYGVLDLIYLKSKNLEKTSYAFIDNVKQQIGEYEVATAIQNLKIDKNVHFGKHIFTNRQPSYYQDATKEYLLQLPSNSICAWSLFRSQGTHRYVDDQNSITLPEHLKVLSFLARLFEKDFHLLAYISPPMYSDVFNVTSKEGRPYMASKSIGTKYQPIVLDKEKIQKWSKIGIYKKLNNILGEDNRNQLERKIILAIDFYIRSIVEQEEDLSVAMSVFGLEALIGTGNDTEENRIGCNLSEKIAFLLGENKEQRHEIISRIKKLYKIRSNVGHGNRILDITTEDMEAKDFLENSICEFIINYGNNRKFTRSEKDINNWFTDCKLSG